MIIGIAGPSCSGKSTIAEAIASTLGIELLHLDGRWISKAEKPVVNGHPSYEQPHQYDGASLLAEMKAAHAEGRDILVEGFLLFCFPEILDLCDHRFYIDVAHEELVRRRTARTAAGGNATWAALGSDDVVDRGWLAHGREEWERWGLPQSKLTGVVILDGHRPAAESAQDVIRTVQNTPAMVR